MKRSYKLFGVISVVFVAGMVLGYVLTMYSLFPTAHSNFIFTAAPDDMPHGNDSPAVSAHLGLIYDVDLLRRQAWRYVLTVNDGEGGALKSIEFTPEQVGGLYRLTHSGSLRWDDDAWAVTASIGDFVYRCEVPRGDS